MLLLLFLLTVIPLAELYLLFQMGEHIGFLPTVGFTILTAVIGSALARSQALAVWADWSESLKRLQSPGHSVLEGLMILIGGVLLLTPGFITDALGFSLLLPWTRRLVLRPIRTAVDRHLEKLRSSGRIVVHTQTRRQQTATERVDAIYESLDEEPPQLH